MSIKWPNVRLGEVICQEREPVGAFDGNGLPVFGVTNVDGVTQTGIKTSRDLSKYLRLKPGWFVYNPYRVNVGSLGLSSNTQDGIVSPAYVVFSPTEKIDSGFLYFYLKSTTGDQLINFYGNRGSVRGALRFNDLSQIEISLPPLEEQWRLVALIKELSSRIQQARNLRQQSVEEAEMLSASALQGLLPEDVREEATLREVCLQITDGEHATPMRIPGSGVPLVSAKNVRDGFLDITTTDFVSQETAAKCWKRCKPTHDDILMVCVGATIGRVCRLFNPPEIVIVRSVAMLRTDPKKVNTRYLEYALESSNVQKQIWDLVKQAAQPCLYLNRMGSLRIPIPSLPKQLEVIEKLDILQKEIQALKHVQTETSIELDALLSSVINSTLKGEL